jgi:hypothetical protein
MSCLQMQAPSLHKLLAQPTTRFDRAVFVVTVSLATIGILYGRGETSRWVLAQSAVQIGLFVTAISYALRACSWGRMGPGAAQVAAAALVFFSLALDSIYHGLFSRHLDGHECAYVVEGLRSGAVRLSISTVSVALGAITIGCVVLVLWLRVIGRLPRSIRLESEPPAFLWLVLALAACWPLTAAPSAIPWRVAAPPEIRDRGNDRFATEPQFKRLLSELRQLERTQPRAVSRLDLLILTLDSLRWDMLRAEVMPHVTSLAGHCLSMSHHYTTGGNTGTGVFGILSGLAAPYYPYASRSHLQPIPLEVLRRLGYRRSAYFVNNMRTYEGLHDLFFHGIEYTYSGSDTVTHVADARMVDDLLAQLKHRDTQVPRMDFVLFDSTHYDYSYPPEFERFTPQMALDLGIRDGLVMGEGINERLRVRGPFVRNRYQNAALWLDSLVAHVVDALGPAGLAHTVLVITGDHGEEFWEKGTFGHGFTLTDEATRVPLVVCAPERLTSQYSYSTHADLFPTLFDLMGVRLGSLAIMSGKSLLRYDPTLDLALVGRGSTLQRNDSRYAAVGDGMKVHWRDSPPYPQDAVYGEQDQEISKLDAYAVDNLVVRALYSKLLRPLPQP